MSAKTQKAQQSMMLTEVTIRDALKKYDGEVLDKPVHMPCFSIDMRDSH